MSFRLNQVKRPSKKKLRELAEKQNGWMLDCINEQKSQLQPYSSVKDRYLKYFVIRVAKKKGSLNKNETFMENQSVDGPCFKDFLSFEKEKVMKKQVQLFGRRLEQNELHKFDNNKINEKQNTNDNNRLNKDNNHDNLQNTQVGFKKENGSTQILEDSQKNVDLKRIN